MLRSFSAAAFAIALFCAPTSASAGNFMDGAGGNCFLCEFFKKKEPRKTARTAPETTSETAPAASQALNAVEGSDSQMRVKALD